MFDSSVIVATDLTRTIDSVDTNLMLTQGLTAQLKRAARRVLRRDGVTAQRVVKADNPGSHTLLELSVRFAGRHWLVTVRDGTTDLDLIDMLLAQPGMYQLPASVDPKVIFDVGANIGIAALYFAAVYPEAQIHCFEPLPANIELLRRNAERNPGNIIIHPFGLSEESGTFTYHMSANRDTFGGGTFHRIGADTDVALKLPVSSVDSAIAHAGVEGVDVFKIDTEGAEWPILKAVPPEVRGHAQAFVGELHGLNDWDFCNLLCETHDIDLDKRYHRNCHPFLAVRKDLAASRPLAA